MKQQHTPGPWKADGYDVRQSSKVGSRMIAYTGPHHTPDSEYPKACRMADEVNARLIASAPELHDMIIAFCEGQKFAAEVWKNQEHIKPLFEYYERTI
jgi:hypothetical protein